MKVDMKVDTAERAKTEGKIAQKIGKPTAKEFVHENIIVSNNNIVLQWNACP